MVLNVVEVKPRLKFFSQLLVSLFSSFVPVRSLCFTGQFLSAPPSETFSHLHDGQLDVKAKKRILFFTGR